MWVWAKKTQINPLELKKKLFLAKDGDGYLAWHRAAIEGSIETLETLWICSKEVEISTEELLLAETGKGYTAFHWATIRDEVESLKKMWAWAEKTKINPQNLKKKLFQAKDEDGFLAWHRAALLGRIQTL
jgi:ankyrin repeat protein